MGIVALHLLVGSLIPRSEVEANAELPTTLPPVYLDCTDIQST